MTKLRIATRPGKLALEQSRIVINAVRQIYPHIELEIKLVQTHGDRDQVTRLWQMKKVGFFTSEIEQVLLDEQIDVAVHSYKDLPTQQNPDLTIAAVYDRKYVEDCVVYGKGISSINDLPTGAKIGTSSLRRAVQLKKLRPDLQIKPIRGNVPTRLKKLDDQKYDAIVLARAGLERLKLSERISLCFDPKEFIPAPAQGALALQVRKNDAESEKIISSIDQTPLRYITDGERTALAVLQCGCHAPAGIYGWIEDEALKLTGFVSDMTGKQFICEKTQGPLEQAKMLGQSLAQNILNQGGQALIDQFKQENSS